MVAFGMSSARNGGGDSVRIPNSACPCQLLRICGRCICFSDLGLLQRSDRRARIVLSPFSVRRVARHQHGLRHHSVQLCRSLAIIMTPRRWHLRVRLSKDARHLHYEPEWCAAQALSMLLVCFSPRSRMLQRWTVLLLNANEGRSKRTVNVSPLMTKCVQHSGWRDVGARKVCGTSRADHFVLLVEMFYHWLQPFEFRPESTSKHRT